ncbi:MAG: hypothetical protein CMF43_04195 [Legionellales bacterium]|nr:hypothetical protein [Legionellales bacterium]
MQPCLIKKEDHAKRKVNAWHNGLIKTGYMRTSALPDLSDVKTTHHKEDTATVEAIEFNESISVTQLSQLIQSNLIQLDHKLALLDFDMQVVDAGILSVLLQWIKESNVAIKQLNLSSLGNCSRAWRLFFDWLFEHPQRIESINLGDTRLNLSRVKDLVCVLQDEKISIERLDLGSSMWSFADIKSFVWMGGLTRTAQLSRFSLGDSRLCQHGQRLLVQAICQASSSIRIFSSGITQLDSAELTVLLSYLHSADNQLRSCVLSNQTLDADHSAQLADVISQANNVQSLGIINCWIDHKSLASHTTKVGVIPNLYIEAITGGQIQQLSDTFHERGYETSQQISRHRVRMALANIHAR